MATKRVEAIMPTVGIRELKDKLSHYLKRVERGEWIAITNRGKVIALLTPAGRDLGEGALRLIEEGLASWTGGKPHGSPISSESTWAPAFRARR